MHLLLRTGAYHYAFFLTCLLTFCIIQLVSLRRALENRSVQSTTTIRVQLDTQPPLERPSPLCTKIKNNKLNLTVVVKTGATEAWDKIPTLLLTTLKCANDFIFFSDMEDDILGHHVFDALENVSSSAQDPNADFDLYRLQNQYRLEGRDVGTLKQTHGSQAWALDKYKNIHMLEKTYDLRPNSSWYLFVDADTYIVWTSLLQWLERLNASDSLYLGSIAWLEDMPFAHGGSGYVISQAAMQEVHSKRPGMASSVDEKTSKECCGDAELARALKDIDIVPFQLYPMINGEHLTSIAYGPDKWCEPIITMHHVLPSEMNIIWDYERERENVSEPILLKELFEATSEGSIPATQTDWYNYSDESDNFEPKDDQQEAHDSFYSCGNFCRETEACYQYLYTNRTCTFSESFKIGEGRSPSPSSSAAAAPANTGLTYHSGWDLEKIRQVREKSCLKPHWIAIGNTEND